MSRSTYERNERIEFALPSTEPAAVRRWVIHICRLAGLTPSELAKAAGVSPTTLTRFLNERKGGQRNLGGTTLSKLRKAAARLIPTSGAGGTQTAPEAGTDLRVVDDFLPPPAELVLREDTVKVTLALSRRSVDFFKREAGKARVPYQRMIRALVDAYAERATKPKLTGSSRKARG